MSQVQKGNVMAAISFTLWGLLPLYYYFLPQAATDELLAVRLIASVPLTLFISRYILGQWPNWRHLFGQKKDVMLSLIASLMMSICWCAFTWALTNGRVIDASLGFFIGPIAMIALGVIVLKEALSQGQKLALLFAIAGLSYSVIGYGELPFIALIMALFFTLYGWAKRNIHYEWSQGLLMECVLLAPAALVYMMFKYLTQGSEFIESDLPQQLLYLGSAFATLLPLVFYSIAIRLTRMTNIGLMQYIEPSIQFLLATLVFAEPFDHVKGVSFSLIWFGLAVMIYESYRYRRT